MSDFANAARVFDDLAAAYPAHELAPMVSYLSGWSHFSRGEFDKARVPPFAAGPRRSPARESGRAEEPVPVRQEPPEPEEDRRGGARPPADRRRLSAHRVVAGRAVRLRQRARGLRPDAAGGGRVQEAGRTRSPTVPLREDASYRRAETFYLGGMLPEARAAFDDYRTRFPPREARRRGAVLGRKGGDVHGRRNGGGPPVGTPRCRLPRQLVPRHRPCSRPRRPTRGAAVPAGPRPVHAVHGRSTRTRRAPRARTSARSR